MRTYRPYWSRFLGQHRETPPPPPPTKLEFENQEAMLAHLKENGMIVRSKDEDAEYWKNTVQTEKDALTKDIYGRWDKMVHETYGVERDGHEKTMDYFMRAHQTRDAEYKRQMEELQAKLDKKLSESEGAAEVQKQFDAFKEGQKKIEAEYKAKLEQLEGSIFTGKVDTAVQGAMKRIEGMLDPKLNSFTKEKVLKALGFEFKSQVRPLEHNGVIVFHDENDKPIIDPQDGNFLTAFDILVKSVPEDMIDKQRMVPGGGTGPDDDDDLTPEQKELDMALPETVTNVVQLMDFMLANPELKKMKTEDPDKFTKIYNHNKKKVKMEGAIT